MLPFARLVQVATAAFLFVTLAPGCGGAGPAAPVADTGTVALALDLPGGASTDRVDYEITGGDMAPITGFVNVAQEGATITFLVDGLRAGPRYRVALTFTTRDQHVTCSGEAPFNIVAGAVTNLFVPLACNGILVPGSLVVTGTFNRCPVITTFGASPLQVSSGGIITLAGAASDPDPNTTLTYGWSATPATGGTFTNPGGAIAWFRCAGTGPRTLRLSVSDGACSVSQIASVTCAPHPPLSLTIVSPAEGPYVTTVNLIIEAEVTPLDRLSRLEFWDGDRLLPNEPGLPITTASTFLLPGPHTVRVVAYDTDGNSVTATRSFIADFIAPITFLELLPPPPPPFPSLVLLRMVGVDSPSGVDRYELTDGPVLLTSGAGQPGFYSWDTRFVPAGPHVLKLQVWDKAGNVGQATLTVNVTH